MPSTNIEIINEALAQIAVQSITSLSDPTNAAKLANIVYPTALEAVLRMHTWGFATKRAELTLAGAAVFGAENRFSLPAGCLRIVELYNSAEAWKIESGELVTADSAAQVKYVFNETDVTKFDSLFTEVFIYYLAFKLAYPLTRSQELANAKYTQFTTALSAARSVDRNEETPIEIINLSLALLGLPAYSNHNDTQMQLIVKMYESTRDELLATHPWNFAIKRESGLAAGSAPAFGYSYSWILPEDCLRILDVYSNDTVYLYPWLVEAGQLLIALEESPGIRYISRITDATKYPAEFSSAIMYYLASKLAAPVANQPGATQLNYELYLKAVALAKQIDGGEVGTELITNKAVLQLGISSAAIIDGAQAAVVQEEYNNARDELLRAYAWNFATKRITLINPTTPNHGYTWQYALPEQCLRVLDVYNHDGAWKVEGRYILTNTDTSISIRYIERITDITAYTPVFASALTYLLASKLALPLTQKAELVTQNYELYLRVINDAKATEIKENNYDNIIARTFTLIGRNQSLELSNDNVITKTYETARDEVLRAHTWNFAMKRSGALSTTTAPSFGFTYAYTLPADCLRVVELYNSTSPWRVENSVLITNDATAKIKYIAQITDTTKFSASFMNALVYNLASKLAFPIANQSAMTQQYYEMYKNALNEARLVDSAEGVPVTDIVNQALALIGVSSIAALDDNQIRVVERLYTPTLKETLADHEWNFAISRATLVEALPVPDFGYAHKFTLPADNLRVVELYGSDSEWKIEGSYLMTDDSTVKIIYIANITDTTKFSPLFTTALMYHLASKFAVPMAKDKDLQQQNYQLYRNTIDNARSVDSREGTADDITSNALIDVRR